MVKSGFILNSQLESVQSHQVLTSEYRHINKPASLFEIIILSTFSFHKAREDLKAKKGNICENFSTFLWEILQGLGLAQAAATERGP